ncbi:nuclear transport factor 2 family protein [Paenarthrobacter nicotinovorans]|uniref:nuclear transport factor 2 family protein n=1 Tax=Paenarthrobacter nicotinovorans TaxID=29320 RepID=UPI0039A5364A
MTTARELQTSVWDAECRRDLEAVLSHFHPDAVFHPAGGPPKKGHDAIREMTKEFYSVYPELSIEILNEWGNGESSAVFEFRVDLKDNDGQAVTLDGVILVEIQDGKFTAVRYYEDAPVPVAAATV